MKNKPTEEQEKIIELALTGSSFKISASAGSGKTSTLEMISSACSGKKILYLGFNKSIVEQAKTRFPLNVDCKTGHGLAYGKTSKDLKGRLVTSGALIWQGYAKCIERNEAIGKAYGDIVSFISEIKKSVKDDASRDSIGKMAAKAVRATVMAFEQSASADFESKHAYKGSYELISILKFLVREGGMVDPALSVAEQEARARKMLEEHLIAPVVEVSGKIWRESVRPGSDIPISHDTYLKVFQLSKPRLPYDIILFDEAQDANEIMLDITEKQETEKIYVGDRHQSIYGWRGANNAMETVHCPELPLSMSFRFGQALADYANRVLGLKSMYDPKESIYPIRGFESKQTQVYREVHPPGVYPNAILCRTNAGVVKECIDAIDDGKSPYIVGGSSAITDYLDEAYKLKCGKPSSHPDFMLFPSWDDLVAFSEGPDGGGYGVIVGMVEKYKDLVPDISRQIRDNSVATEKKADVTISTAHKAKGMEWGSVRMSDDYSVMGNGNGPSFKLNTEAVNLAYVSVTRGMDSVMLVNIEKAVLETERCIEKCLDARSGNTLSVEPDEESVTMGIGR